MYHLLLAAPTSRVATATIVIHTAMDIVVIILALFASNFVALRAFVGIVCEGRAAMKSSRELWYATRTLT